MTEKNVLDFYNTLIKILEDKFNVTIVYELK